jgi:hypothetical protein
MVKIFISRKAMKDLNTIKAYIAQDNPTRAASFCEELLSQTVIPPFLTSVKTRVFLAYSSCRGGTPPIAECGRILL